MFATACVALCVTCGSMTPPSVCFSRPWRSRMLVVASLGADLFESFLRRRIAEIRAEVVDLLHALAGIAAASGGGEVVRHREPRLVPGGGRHFLLHRQPR